MPIKTDPKPPERKRNRNEETQIQVACVLWFTNNFVEIKNLLYAVPNETNETSADARRWGAIRRMMGTRRGVSDLCLDIARHNFHGLRIELKTPQGTQQPEQKEWEALVTKEGYLYRICRSVDDFKALIEWYLGEDLQK